MEQEKSEVLLKDYNDMEKGAYLGAIASIATADHSASEDEIEYLTTLADSANLSNEQKQSVIKAATELSDDELKKCLDVLKNSQLKYSLVTDLINFGESDSNYTPEEKSSIDKIAQYLNINEQQFSLLKEFSQKTSHVEVTPEQVQKPGFLASLGLGDLENKFKNSGINMGGMTKGLLGIAGPMILANLLTKGLGGGRRGSNPFGMGSNRGRGGAGSLISALNGGRGFSGAGGLLGRLLPF